MAAVFGSANLANASSKGNAHTAQDMIGTTAGLLANSNAMQNGHIGAAYTQVVTPASRAELIAADGTPGLNNVGAVIQWATATGTWGAPPP